MNAVVVASAGGVLIDARGARAVQTRSSTTPKTTHASVWMWSA